MSKNKQVKVLLRGPEYEMRTPLVYVKWECPECNEVMGEPIVTKFHENGETYSCHAWNNDCGHTPMYNELKIVTSKGYRSWAEAKANNESLNEFCFDATCMEIIEVKPKKES